MNMKDTLEKSKERWMQLAEREKQAVLIGGLIVILFILYQCIWSPILNHIEDMRKRIATNQKTLLWMRSADRTMQNMGHQSAKKKTVSLVMFLSEMQHRIQSAGLLSSLTQLKQSANEAIEMHFQTVEFDKLIRFLLAVTHDYPVSISRFSVSKTDVSGVVSADIVMKQG